MNQYYGWPHYWNMEPMLTVPMARPDMLIDAPESDPHLRSFREVSAYSFAAADREWGSVEDFLADDQTWQIQQLVIASPDWLSRKKVMLATSNVARVSWADRLVSTRLTAAAVEDGPVYDPASVAGAGHKG